MGYDAKPFKRYKRGDILTAADLNEAFRRLERLENISAHAPIHIAQTSTGIDFSLSTVIPEIEYVKINDQLNCDDNQVVTAFLLDHNTDENTYVEKENEVEARNMFKYSTEPDTPVNAFIVRFPRGRGEWIIIRIEEQCEEEE